MKKKIKKIATGGIVGTLLFVSSGSVRAQGSALPTRTAQRDEIQDSETSQEDEVSVGVGIAANDDVYGDSRQELIEQGFSASQIQKLNRRG